MTGIDVLMPAEGMARISPSGSRAGVKLHKLWLESDREAALARLAPDIRVVVATITPPGSTRR